MIYITFLHVSLPRHQCPLAASAVISMSHQQLQRWSAADGRRKIRTLLLEPSGAGILRARGCTQTLPFHTSHPSTNSCTFFQKPLMSRAFPTSPTSYFPGSVQCPAPPDVLVELFIGCQTKLKSSYCPIPAPVPCLMPLHPARRGESAERPEHPGAGLQALVK